MQLWDRKTRCDLKLPLHLYRHQRLCHRLLQVNNMAVMYPQHQEIILSITFLDKIFLSSFGHEIGHNFGADHNRESGTVAPYDDAYGHWIQVGVNVNPKHPFPADRNIRVRWLQNYHGLQRVWPLHKGELLQQPLGHLLHHQHGHRGCRQGGQCQDHHNEQVDYISCMHGLFETLSVSLIGNLPLL